MAAVRDATLTDIPDILRLIERFNSDYFDVPLNLSKTINMVAWIIEDGVGLITPGGFIGGIVVTDLIRDWSILQEFGWYAEDRSGITLLEKFIDAGRDLGVDEVRVCTLSTSSPMAGRILQRKGFAPLETSYRLKIGAETCPHSRQSSQSPP